MTGVAQRLTQIVLWRACQDTCVDIACIKSYARADRVIIETNVGAVGEI
jgi:hypothetical protein